MFHGTMEIHYGVLAGGLCRLPKVISIKSINAYVGSAFNCILFGYEVPLVFFIIKVFQYP
jgi:hypothetical protein